MVLPQNLVERLPYIGGSEIRKYWDHLSNSGSPLAMISPGKNHYPLWIWGDEAQYRENGDEVLLICCGAILDKRSYSIESCYPLCICRSEAGFLFSIAYVTYVYFIRLYGNSFWWKNKT